VRDLLDRLHRRDHTQRTVEAAAVGRRIEVRSGHHHADPGAGTGHATNQIAGRVGGGGQPGLTHPALHQLERTLLAVPQAGPVCARSAADCEQPIEALTDAGGSVDVGFWHRARVADCTAGPRGNYAGETGDPPIPHGTTHVSLEP
jgi:hypothetical protein